MKTPIEELNELIDVGGVRFGQRPKYSRSYPPAVEQAIRTAAAADLVNRLQIGSAITMSGVAAGAFKLALKNAPDVKVKWKTINQDSFCVTRIS